MLPETALPPHVHSAQGEDTLGNPFMNTAQVFKLRAEMPLKCLNTRLRGDAGAPMEQGHHLAFGPFHVDGTPGRWWQGARAIALRPQSLAMRRYLVAYPGRLV
jgi:hypothetical protein